MAGANLPIWASNNIAYAAADTLSYDLQKKDKNNIMLPKGFSSRIVAVTGKRASFYSSYKWHRAPDGGAVFPTIKGGWVYVSNSEVGGKDGGVGALEFDKNANIINSYSICSKTSANCAGGPTPWNTWLSCEETSEGFVWDCDPMGKKQPVKCVSLGKFVHEAAAVDPKNYNIYLTEDHSRGGFYRFVPKEISNNKPNFNKGTLQVANIKKNKKVEWIDVPDPLANNLENGMNISPLMKRKKNKKIKYTIFNRGEGAWFHERKVFFATTGDHLIWTYDTVKKKFEKIYEGNGSLTDPDNVTVSQKGLVLAAEDSGNMEIVAISQKTKNVFPLLRIVGHKKSEITGPAFDPSGKRLYFSSQRGKDGETGITFEVTGPFEKYA